jgi:hypothetical protein
MMNLHQNPRGQWERSASLCHESGQLRHHECYKNRNESGAGQREKGRIDQRLLHTVS